LKEIQQPPNAKDEETLEPPEEAEADPNEPFGPDFEAPSIPPQAVDITQTDSPDTPMRFMEKKRLHWNGKTCK
jgi:tRNA-dihydrouridine synthase 3